MNIAKNTVVTFSYVLKKTTGEEVDRAEPDDPMSYLHGHQNILLGLEQALEGGTIGDKLDVNLSAANAYGVRVEGREQRVPIKHLMAKPRKLVKGAIVKVNTEQGPRDATVVKAGKFNVDIDTNHPLAGIDLCFSVAIHEVREATPEEVSHGHAHGIGGHHH